MMNFFRNLLKVWPVAAYNKVVSWMPSARWKKIGVGLGSIIVVALLVLAGLKIWSWWGGEEVAIEEKKGINYVVSVDVFGPKESAIFTCGDFFEPRIGLPANSLVEVVVADGQGFWVSNPTNPVEQGAVAAFDEVCHIVFVLEGQKYRLTSGITRIKNRIGGPMGFAVGLSPALNPEMQVVSGSGLTAAKFDDFQPGKVELVVRVVDSFDPYSTAAQKILPITEVLPGVVKGGLVPPTEITAVGGHIVDSVITAVYKTISGPATAWGRTNIPIISDATKYVLDENFNIVPAPTVTSATP